MSTQRGGACCSGKPTQVTFIEVRGSKVGMVGLEQVFEQFYQAGRTQDAALEKELVEQARVYNYIAPGSEEAYQWALLRAYRAYVRGRERRKGRPA